jgi:hypothetical protein
VALLWGIGFVFVPVRRQVLLQGIWWPPYDGSVGGSDRALKLCGIGSWLPDRGDASLGGAMSSTVLMMSGIRIVPDAWRIIERSLPEAWQAAIPAAEHKAGGRVLAAAIDSFGVLRPSAFGRNNLCVCSVDDVVQGLGGSQPAPLYGVPEMVARSLEVLM